MKIIPIGLLKNNDKRALVLFLGLFLLVAFFTTSMASYFVSKNKIRDSILSSELPLTSDNIYTEIQKDLLLPLYISSTMANDTFLRDWVVSGEQGKDSIQKYLAEIKIKYDTISSFFVSEITRNYYYSEGILKKVSPEEPRDTWYFRVQQMDHPYEINVDPDMANQDTITIFINYKVYDFQGNYIGATGVGLTAKMIKERIREYRRKFHRNVYFINRTGEIILQNQNLLHPLKEGKNIREINGLMELADRILGGKQGSFEYRENARGILLNSRFIPELNWYLMVEQEVDPSLQPLKNTLYLNLVICLVVTLIVLGIVTFTVLRFQKRLETRNRDLEIKSEKIEQQRQQLEVQTRHLSEFNRKLEHLNKEKDEFLGIAAHDLRSPLSGIVGAAELISEDDLPRAERNTYLHYIIENGTDMLDLITNFLDVSAIELTKDLETVPVNLEDVINDSIKSFSLHAKTKQIVMQTTMPEEPVYTLTHHKWLSNIVSNLISNAIKFSPRESAVHVELTQTEKLARFTVKDQGPGLSPEDKKNIFSRFTRLSAKPTGGESSSGLGLYIVKKLTEKLGGTVWCESEYGIGSSFIVELPLASHHR